MDKFSIAQLNELPAQLCPCGTTRRAFAETAGAPASVHRVDISEDARAHYHKKMTEIYVVLEGDGQIELDGQKFPVGPMTSILIKPGCRHRAIGKLRIINVAVPVFDPADEWFD